MNSIFLFKEKISIYLEFFYFYRIRLFLTIATIFITSHVLAQKVYSVEYASQADIKIFFTEYASQAK
jgi:hypothetical protein